MSDFSGTEPMRVEFDEKVEFLRQLQAINARLKDPLDLTTFAASRFVSKTQVYIATVIDRMIRDGGGIQEGGSMTLRGVTWPGWATHQRAAYGGFVTESTRYRFRKAARGSTAAKTGRTWTRERRALEMKKDPAARPWEMVYKKRASGARYTAGSQLMQDTGRMRAGVFMMELKYDGSAIEIRPNTSNVQYLEAQNARRPFWFLEEKDQNEVTAIAQLELNAIADAITKGEL